MGGGESSIMDSIMEKMSFDNNNKKKQFSGKLKQFFYFLMEFKQPITVSEKALPTAHLIKKRGRPWGRGYNMYWPGYNNSIFHAKR